VVAVSLLPAIRHEVTVYQRVWVCFHISVHKQ
jgi:hypothetical protein